MKRTSLYVGFLLIGSYAGEKVRAGYGDALCAQCAHAPNARTASQHSSHDVVCSVKLMRLESAHIDRVQLCVRRALVCRQCALCAAVYCC